MTVERWTSTGPCMRLLIRVRGRQDSPIFKRSPGDLEADWQAVRREATGDGDCRLAGDIEKARKERTRPAWNRFLGGKVPGRMRRCRRNDQVDRLHELPGCPTNQRPSPRCLDVVRSA